MKETFLIFFSILFLLFFFRLCYFDEVIHQGIFLCYTLLYFCKKERGKILRKTSIAWSHIFFLASYFHVQKGLGMNVNNNFDESRRSLNWRCCENVLMAEGGGFTPKNLNTITLFNNKTSYTCHWVKFSLQSSVSLK